MRRLPAEGVSFRSALEGPCLSALFRAAAGIFVLGRRNVNYLGLEWNVVFLALVQGLVQGLVLINTLLSLRACLRKKKKNFRTAPWFLVSFAPTVFGDH